MPLRKDGPRRVQGECAKCEKPGLVDRVGWCYPCQKEQMRDHYLRNKEKYMARAATQKAVLRALVDSLKDRPCADCGINYPPWVMDLDHLDPATKVASVSEMVNTRATREGIIAEAAKCDAVCANCHRQRTHARSEALKLVSTQTAPKPADPAAAAAGQGT